MPRRRGLVAGLILAVVLLSTPFRVQASGPQHGGVFLDGYGGLHPFGGLTLDTSRAAYWNGYDIARAVTVREDGSGGWVLDGWGGIHPFGSAPAVSFPSWGWDIARDLVIVTRTAGILDGASGYILDGFGGVHAWGGAPQLSGAPYTPGRDIARGLSIHTNGGGVPDGGWVLRSDGSVVAFGGAGALVLTLPHDDVQQKLHVLGNGTAGYAVAHWGITTTFGPISPYWNGYGDWNGWSITRDIQLLDPTNPAPQTQPSSAAARQSYQATLQPHGGAVLDGWGGVHAFGDGFFPLNTTNAPYWGWDIARSLAVRPDGAGGWVLDGYGGIHAFGNATAVTSPGYWGWDIARDMVVTSRDAGGEPDGRQGYLLDGFGGLHPWGGAPALTGPSGIVPGFDLARGLEIHYSAGVPDGAWILDVFGVVHSLGNAPPITSPSPFGPKPLWRHLHAVGNGMMFIGRNGVTLSSGDIGTPYWSGYPDWGRWDINRDIVLVNPVSPTNGSQPRDPGADQGFAAAVSGSYGVSTPLYAQLRALDCESAALQMALAARGSAVSQDWILGVMGADLRSAVKDRYGTVLQWGNPYQTFVGNVNGSEPYATGYGVYYPPIAAAAQRAGRAAIGAEGWRPADLYGLVAAGYPAVVWNPFLFAGAVTRTWTAWDGTSIRYIRNEHATTLTGVDFGRGTVTINDPEYGVKVFSMAFFESQWSYLNNMAVAVG